MLALAGDKRNVSEEETDTAMRMAAAMAAKYGIDLNSLRTADTPKAKVMHKRNREEMTFQQIYAAQAAAIMMGVRFYVYDEGRRGFEFVGRDDLIEMAEQLMFFLMRQVEEIYKASLPKGLSKRDRAEFRRTFKPACSLRVKQRAAEAMRDLKTNEGAAKAATGHNALVVAGYYDTLKQEIDEYEAQRYAPTPEQVERAAKLEAERKEREKKWREENPEAAARADKEAERDRKRWERQAARRKGRREREMPQGSGTRAGYDAGAYVKLNREVKGG
jgi:hypothetical protein